MRSKISGSGQNAWLLMKNDFDIKHSLTIHLLFSVVFTNYLKIHT
jgi:hypothetical protein